MCSRRTRRVRTARSGGNIRTSKTVRLFLTATTYMLSKGIEAKWRGPEFGEGVPRGRYHGRKLRLSSGGAHRLADLPRVLPDPGDASRRHYTNRCHPALPGARGVRRDRAPGARHPVARSATVRS